MRSRVWCGIGGAVLTALALSAGAASAQSAPSAFTYVAGGGGGDEDDVSGFMALSERRREGDAAFIPSLAIHDDPTDAPFRYVIAVVRYDCKARTGEPLRIKFFDAAHNLMGETDKGLPANGFDEGSAADRMTIRLACGEIEPGAGNPTFPSAAEAVAWSEKRRLK